MNPSTCSGADTFTTQQCKCVCLFANRLEFCENVFKRVCFGMCCEPYRLQIFVTVVISLDRTHACSITALYPFSMYNHSLRVYCNHVCFVATSALVALYDISYSRKSVNHNVDSGNKPATSLRLLTVAF